MTSEFESDLQDTVDWGRKWLVDYYFGKTKLVSFECFSNSGAIDSKRDGSVLEEKLPFKMLSFFSKLDWGSYIVSIAKSISKKIEAFIRFMKFLSAEVVPYMYKSTILPCMEYFYQVWVGAPTCYLDMLVSYKNRYIGLLVQTCCLS